MLRRDYFNHTVNETMYTTAIFDDSQLLVWTSNFAMYLILCIAFLLVVSYMVFTSDVQVRVRPLCVPCVC